MENSIYFTRRGLLKRIKEEPDAIENEFLFGLEYLLVSDKKESEMILKSLSTFWVELIDKGQPFANHIDDEVLKHQPNLSHDQLTTYFVYYILMYAERENPIWKNIKFFRYAGRIVHPRDWIFYGICSNDLRAFFFIPLLYLMLIFTFFRNKTVRTRKTVDEKHLEIWIKRRTTKVSSEMLWFIRMQVFGFFVPRIVYRVFKKTMLHFINKRFGGLSGLIKTYFWNDKDHPIVKGANNASLPIF